MAEPKLLEGVLEGSQVPHQPLLVISESITTPGLPLFTEILRRAERSGQKAVLVTALHSASAILPAGSTSRVVDLTDSVPGYATSGNGDTSLSELTRRIKTEYESAGEKASIYIDALDILAEDYSTSGALRLFRDLLQLVKDSKPPSRLVLLLPSTSPLLPSLLPPTISSTLTLLTPHPPPLLTYLSQAYLVPIEASPRFWQILETAQSRHLATDLAYKGEAGLEVGCAGDIVVQVLVRKATGGSKGIARSLEALVSSSSSSSSRNTPSTSTPSSSSNSSDGMSVKPVSEIMSITPITAAPASGPGSGAERGAPPKTHADLDLPFNLTLTDQQKAARMGVPLPYAHEGEGAAVDLEIDDEEDEDDEEI